MSKDPRDNGLEHLLLPQELKGYRYDAETRAAAGHLSYDGAKVLLSTVVKFSDDTDFDAVLLFAAMTRILGLLDLAWYISFAGAKSSGKTTAARIVRFLSNHVIEAGQVSSAGLPAAMRVASGLLLDEVDVLLKKEGGDTIAAILRQGTDRDSPYLKMVESGHGKEWTLEPVPVFGPKILTFKRKVDDALGSRSDLIRMPRARDPNIRRQSTRFRRTLLPLKAWLDGEAKRVLREWTKAKVDAYVESEEFVRNSDALVTDLDRTGQIGDLMLTVAHLYSWETAQRAVQARLGVIEEASADETSEEVRGALLYLYAHPPSGTSHALDGGGIVIKKSAIKAYVDRGRHERSEKPLWTNTLAELLDDLGFEQDQRFGKEDRDRAIRITAESVARLSKEVLDEVGHRDTIPTPPSENRGIPPRYPRISEPTEQAGLPARPPLSVPSPNPVALRSERKPGHSLSPDGGSPLGIPASQVSHLPPEAITNVRLLFNRVAPDPVTWLPARSELSRQTGISESEYDGAVGGLLGSGELVQVSDGVFRQRKGDSP